MHAAAALQDTAAHRVPIDRPTPGVAWARQPVPFHCSASDPVLPPPPLAALLILVAPTAVHAAAAEQDTARNSPPVDPGAGVARTLQVLPFQASASSAVAPLRVPELPVAVQAAGELHDTPLNPEPTAPAGPGPPRRRAPPACRPAP